MLDWLPNLSRELVLAVTGTLFLLGVAATAERILRARRLGTSLRLQIFVPLAATTLALSATFAFIVIDRMQARAAVFARRAAEDEAHVLAALLQHALAEPGATLDAAARDLSRTGVLQAFSRGAIDTRVEVIAPAGAVLIDVGAVPDSGLLPRAVGPAVVEASVPVELGRQTLGKVRVRKGTFGTAQLLSDVAPKVGLLALLFAVASAVVAFLLGGAVAAPIERLTRAAERVAAGERQAALPEPRGREVRLLTRALESMRRELEERHAQEAFVADLSHELKNPIASIRAASEVLEEGAADNPETARRFAGRIRESAGKLHALTADLLSLARLEARGYAPAREEVDLRLVAREAIDAHGAQASRRQVKLELRSSDGTLVQGDPTWLRRALENLIANALQHSPPGGKVTVLVEPSSLGDGMERKPAVAVAVADEGPGVDPAMRDRLFVRFATTRHGEGGTGLGLAIVRAVAEVHGGAARLREGSAPGAVFELVLPR